MNDMQLSPARHTAIGLVLVWLYFLGGLTACTKEPDVSGAPASAAAPPVAEIASREPLDAALGARAFESIQKRALPVSRSPRSTARVVPRRQNAESRTYDLVIESPAGVQTVIEDVVNVGDIEWSPDGKMLAFCEGALVSVVMGETGQIGQLYVGPGGKYPGACDALQWLNEGSRLSVIQFEHAYYGDLANPQRVILSLVQGGGNSHD